MGMADLFVTGDGKEISLAMSATQMAWIQWQYFLNEQSIIPENDF